MMNVYPSGSQSFLRARRNSVCVVEVLALPGHAAVHAMSSTPCVRVSQPGPIAGRLCRRGRCCGEVMKMVMEFLHLRSDIQELLEIFRMRIRPFSTMHNEHGSKVSSPSPLYRRNGNECSEISVAKQNNKEGKNRASGVAIGCMRS